MINPISNDVCIEPKLSGETLDNETANTDDREQLDIAENGLWGGQFKRSSAYLQSTCPNLRTPHCPHVTRNMKKWSKGHYEQRVHEVEHATFTPIVLSVTGDEATHLFKRLAIGLAWKWDQPYSSTMSWLLCRITFSLLWSAIQCIRGARSSIGNTLRSMAPMAPVDLVASESKFAKDY